MKVKVKGLDKVKNRINALKNPSEVQKAVYAGAILVEGTAKRSILQGGKSGTVYQRGNISHQASAPGEAPASDSGILASSIHTQVASDGLSAKVGTTLDRAKHLEFGTRNMSPRPFLQPALDVNRRAILARLKQAVRDVIRRSKS